MLGEKKIYRISVDVEKEIIQILESIDLLKEEKLEETFEIPPSRELGDVSTNICFSLSRKLNKSVLKLAEEIASQIIISPDSLVTKVKAVRGYINFYIKYELLSFHVLNKVLDEKCDYGGNELGKGKKVIVEFPSVNPGKPWHVGHSRTAIIGDTIQRILRFSGYNVESQDYIDDLGLQVAQVLWGILKLPDFELPKKVGLTRKEDQWQGRIYIKIANRFVTEKSVENQVRELMKKMESSNLKVQNKLVEVVESCIKAQYQTAFRLSIYHDVKVHESDIVSSGLYQETREMIVKSDKIVRENSGINAGCLVAKLDDIPEFEGMKSPEKILIRSDGTATYICKDLAYQLWKFNIIQADMKFKPWLIQPNGKEMWTSTKTGNISTRFGHADIVINVIGSEQKYPQKVLSHILRLMGYKRQFKKSIHLAHEHVRLKEERRNLSGRTGTWIGFTTDEVLDEAQKRALIEVEKRNPHLTNGEKKKIAESVGIAAFRFSMLDTNRDKIVEFDYNQALSFKGETGSYLQYAFTRICGILRKAKDWKIKYSIPNLTKEEKTLVRIISEFPETVKESTKDLKPSLICKYAYTLATALDKFYENCPVLKSETKDLRNFRLTLILSTRIVLKNVFDILGIKALEKM
jgi:arginyl-tRNA synthetase